MKERDMRLSIVGTGRCGSNMLWQMMNLHPKLFVFNETHWLVPLHDAFGLGQAPVDQMLDILRRTHHATGLAVTDLDEAGFRDSPFYRETFDVRGFANAVGGFMAAAQGKEFWADKTPDYGYFTRELQQQWPQLPVLHLIRDGAACARSMSRHRGYKALAALGQVQWPPIALDSMPPEEAFEASAMEAFASLWVARIQQIRAASEGLAPGSFMELHYEDLVLSPRRALAQIAAFAGLEACWGWPNRMETTGLSAC